MYVWCVFDIFMFLEFIGYMVYIELFCYSIGKFIRLIVELDCVLSLELMMVVVLIVILDDMFFVWLLFCNEVYFFSMESVV